MTIVLRQKKGVPLTVEEVDNNFIELLKRIEQLEQSSPAHEYLIDIQQHGDVLIFMGNLGSELGRAQMPTLKLTPRGVWKINCLYHINDLITHNGIVYACVHNHTSQTFDQDVKHWSKMFEPYKIAATTAPAHESNSAAISIPAATVLPILNNSKIPQPVFGSLAIHINNNTLDVLVGDIGCWRRVRDQTEVKFGA